MARHSDSNTSNPGQSKRPALNHHVSHDSDSQVSDPASQTQQRAKQHKHVVGGGRIHTRVSSSKALHKAHITSSAAKLKRQKSPSPERPLMLASTHRRQSEVRLVRDPSASNLKKNSSHTSLKRNKSHIEVGKRAKSGANIKRASSHKDMSKLKSTKGQVHFDLGTDGQDDDEWVDASGSASPYLSRRGSVISSGQSSAKVDNGNHTQPPHTPPTLTSSPETHREDHDTCQHKEYLTSRILQRIPSHGPTTMMSAETVSIPPHNASPDSPVSRGSSTVFGTPKTGNGHDELTSRFVSGPSSGGNGETSSYYTPTKPDRVRRPQSMGNLTRENRDSLTAEPDDEDDSALAPRTRRSMYTAPPADKSRTQQKLNLQRASSSIEPTQAGGGAGAVGASPLVGGSAYDNRDPRIGKLLERTGSEYLVVRRYQNPIARSIARLQSLSGANKTRQIPKQNGANGSLHKKATDIGGSGRYGLSSSLVESQRSRPGTPRKATSIRTNGANSSFEADEDRVPERLSGASYIGVEDEGAQALLRNLWDKSLDLSASQD